MRGYEDHRSFRTHRRQTTPQLNAGHAGHVYVDDNAHHIGRAIARKKCFSGIENFRGKARRFKYALDSPQNAGFVINNRDYLSVRQISPA